VLRNGTADALLVPANEEIDPSWDEIMADVRKARQRVAPHVRIRSWQKGENEIMPLVYADSSALFAYLHPNDEFSIVVDAAVQKDSPDFVYWAWLRYELRHNLRMQEPTPMEKWHGRRCGRRKDGGTAALAGRTDGGQNVGRGGGVSTEKARGIVCGSGDYLHVAAARRLNLLSGLMHSGLVTQRRQNLRAMPD